MLSGVDCPREPRAAILLVLSTGTVRIGLTTLYSRVPLTYCKRDLKNRQLMLFSLLAMNLVIMIKIFKYSLFVCILLNLLYFLLLIIAGLIS